MIPSLDKFLNHKYVLHREWEDLVICAYTNGCTYDHAWDEVTRAARGIIFNLKTGTLVARPFAKFFNLNEMPETQVASLPDEPFTVTEKLDGSLGILYEHRGEWRVATKGAFLSEQAAWATTWVRDNLHVDKVKSSHTYLFEIIYPENKIVIDYGDFRGLVLLACVDKESGREMPHEALLGEGAAIGADVVKLVTGFSRIDELYTYCRRLPHSQEGFVVTFAGGLKVKMKGEEYCKIHRMISNLTPLAFWNTWDTLTREIPSSFLAQVPEEFRDLSDQLNAQIVKLHEDLHARVQGLHDRLVAELGGNPDRKAFAIAAKERYPEEFAFLMFLRNGPERKLWDAIHRHVRPTGNVLPAAIKGMERVKRVLAEG